MATIHATRPRVERRSVWDRELEHYPSTGTRFTSLGIVIAATVVLYYQFYLAGAVATRIIADYHMSFVYYVNISVVGYVLGAIASFVTGLADRYGRSNIVTVGLFAVAALCLFGIPNAHSKLAFGVVFVLIGFVEGIILVATPALIRDFSPQLGRASAMGFWTLGPVLGSLVVSIEVSNTSNSTAWQDHYIAAGIVGLVIAFVALFGLRELAPRLRDQVMVSSKDRVLIEARAKGIDIEASLRRPFRQMLKADIIGSAFAISVFLIIYYLAVGFFPVYFQTVFGFSQSKANALGNWFWACDAAALLIIGFASDKLRVRKPFMLVGAVGAIAFTVLFAEQATDAQTSYGTFVMILIGLSTCLGIAYAPWMASFTETVERRNPALTATGLAVWGLVIRIVIALSVFFVPHVVDTVTTIVDKGSALQAAAAGHDPALTARQNEIVKQVAADPSLVSRAQTLATTYSAQLATAAKIDAATQAKLAANPTDQTAQVTALSEISGVPAANVVTIVTLNAQHADALAAGAVVDPATIATLLTNPNDAAAGAAAVQQIVTRLHLTPAQALARLQELRTIPIAQLLLLQSGGTKVTTAATQLTALASVPKDDLQFLSTTGAALQDPKVQASLRALQAGVPTVARAQADAPGQWQTYFWIAVFGELLFIPFIFVMTGFWNPRRARDAEHEHELWVEKELAELSQAH